MNFNKDSMFIFLSPVYYDGSNLDVWMLP